LQTIDVSLICEGQLVWKPLRLAHHKYVLRNTRRLEHAVYKIKLK